MDKNNDCIMILIWLVQSNDGLNCTGVFMGENNFKSYINDFFDELVLYDDYYNDHYYKGLLKAGIDVFLDTENVYNAYEIYQTFYS